MRPLPQPHVRHYVLVLLLTFSTVAALAPTPATAAARDIYVATNGDNSNSGTRAQPYRDIRTAIGRARPGDTITVRGGTYREVAGGVAQDGRRDAPIMLRNEPGERVVLQGVLRFKDTDWWTVDGIDVTADPTGEISGAPVAFKGGSNWTLRNSEIWGSRATANLLIQGGDQGPAERFKVTNNCIHDADSSGRQSTDHNIYLFNGLRSTGGVIERNILFNAPNGANVKMGGPQIGDDRGPANVDVRFNTMARGAAGVIVYGDAEANRVRRNLFTDHINGDATYNGAIVAIRARGRANRIVDNAWHDHPNGYRAFDSSGNAFQVVNHRRVSTNFNRTRSCGGYRPTDNTASLFGRYAKNTPLPDLPPQFIDTRRSVFAQDIQWLATKGITAGCNPPTNDRFCPDDAVTRGQMAAFLTRSLDLRPSSRNAFRDDNGSVFQRDIQALAAADITAGCNPPANTRYCPDDIVTRGAMAAFLDRALPLKASSRDAFRDDNRSVFESNIQALAAADITAGCNPPANTRYCPDDVVTRGQMAAFLKRALD